jgi:hypothetical protein
LNIYPLIILFHRKPFHLILRKSVDKRLKNHYIISNKTSINNGKTACKK